MYSKYVKWKRSINFRYGSYRPRNLFYIENLVFEIGHQHQFWPDIERRFLNCSITCISYKSGKIMNSLARLGVWEMNKYGAWWFHAKSLCIKRLFWKKKSHRFQENGISLRGQAHSAKASSRNPKYGDRQHFDGGTQDNWKVKAELRWEPERYREHRWPRQWRCWLRKDNGK